MQTLDAITTQQRLAVNAIVLIDVRELSEFAREHIAGAQCLPLQHWGAHGAQIDAASKLPRDKPIVLCCASGNRSQSALRKLAAAGFDNIAHMEGGLSQWKACGLPLVENPGTRCAPISLMRQVQIVAGSLVFTGTLLGVLVSPWFLLLSGGVGAGLIFAGASGSCLMAQLLARLPYNQQQTYTATHRTA